MHVNTFALLDDGSTITLIDEKLARNIGARGQSVDLLLQGINNEKVTMNNSEKVDINVMSPLGKFEIKCALTVKNLKLPTQTIDDDLISKLRGKEHDVQIESYYNPQVEILIGQDNWKLIATRELRQLKDTDIAISRSFLGWSVHGVMSHTSKATRSVLNIREIAGECESTRQPDAEINELEMRLDELLKYYFEIDSIGVNIKYNKKGEHDRALKILNETSRFLGDRWEIGLLWKEYCNFNIDSYTTAMRRLVTIERRLDRDPTFAALYYKEIRRFIDLRYAVKVDKNAERSKIWYLPHFGVVNINKPNKVRFVFDAAAKTNGVSFNDLLEAGPDLLESLIAVLMRFRQYLVAVAGDIRDMFLRVGVIEEDRGAQRFLWRGKDRDREPDVYEMNTLIFGAKSSPCNAIYIKNKNAERFAETNLDASVSIIKNSYMDDYLCSRKTEEEATNLIRDVIKINKLANFDMHDWVSNRPQVLRDIPSSRQKTNGNEMQLCDKKGERVLGLHWDTQADELKLIVAFKKIPQNILNGEKRPTKREFLHVMMSVFDPLGLIAPFTLKSKLIMQEIWRIGINWDDKLRDDEYAHWLVWISKIDVLKECRVPRCYMSHENDGTAQLHVFCDASLTAYAAVAYLRFERKDNRADVSIVMTKSRIVPLKPLSVPRLELQAALLGARLGNFIEKELEIKISKRWFWSDSSTVIRWIKTEPRTRQVYVANRLGEVSELTKNSEWYWVPTAQNPADYATRFSNDANGKKSWWFDGPEFLQFSESEWPKDNFLNAEEKRMIDNLEIRKGYVCTLTGKLPEFSLPMRLLGWQALLVIARRVRKSFNKWRRSVDKRKAVETLVVNEEFWFREIQADCFRDEINALKKRGEVSKGSKISGLKPYLDDRGILRARGRVTSAPNISFNNNPMILDGKHQASKKFIKKFHQKFYHANSDAIFNELSQNHHVIGLRRTLRSIVQRCIVCRIHRGKPQNPLMGNIPAARVAAYQRPFSHSGVDYFGPMFVKIGRRREKRWGVLFTCLTTRAIHIELVSSLTTSSAIMAIQRLSARRGVPLHMYSDNSTNFHGANAELKQAILNLDADKISQFAGSKQIEWHFNPPDAPHMGGTWERLVRSVKTALKYTLCDQAPSEEVLYTTFCEIEHSVNSRPLTHVSLDPRDNEALTPNHFLLGASSGEVKLGKYDAKYICPRKQYRIAQSYADSFWRRWLREYLPSLRPRKIWTQKQEPLKVGDMVLILDLDSPRNVWKKGRIIHVFPGEDGEVRVANVSTSAGNLMRPARKLIKLLGVDEVQN